MPVPGARVMAALSAPCCVPKVCPVNRCGAMQVLAGGWPLTSPLDLSSNATKGVVIVNCVQKEHQLYL